MGQLRQLLPACSLPGYGRLRSKWLRPAIMPTRRTSTLINLRVETALADWLADRAQAEGTTQKVIITRALAAAGAPVSPQDLEDRTPRRQRR
jgi:hypothetical protein